METLIEYYEFPAGVSSCRIRSSALFSLAPPKKGASNALCNSKRSPAGVGGRHKSVYQLVDSSGRDCRRLRECNDLSQGGVPYGRNAYHIDFVLCSCIQAQYKMLETVALTNNEQSLGNTLKMPVQAKVNYLANITQQEEGT